MNTIRPCKLIQLALMAVLTALAGGGCDQDRRRDGVCQWLVNETFNQ